MERIPSTAKAEALADPADPTSFEYLGFWKRVLATVIDNIIVLIVLFPLGLMLAPLLDKQTAEWADQGMDLILPALAIIVLWRCIGTTPGKMVFGARIVDARTFRNPGLGQSTLRYLGYIPSILPLMGGFLMVAFDAKKRGLHDLIAGTVVVIPKRSSAPRAAAAAS